MHSFSIPMLTASLKPNVKTQRRVKDRNENVRKEVSYEDICRVLVDKSESIIEKGNLDYGIERLSYGLENELAHTQL
jgi:hypothetical protein